MGNQDSGRGIFRQFALSASILLMPAALFAQSAPSPQFLFEQTFAGSASRPPLIPSLRDLTPESDVDGPAIPRLVGRAAEPVFELIRHPRARAGEKIVTISVPKSESGKTDLSAFQVSVKISTPKLVDACNLVTIQGQLSERSLPGASHMKYYEVRIKPGSMSTTYKACVSHERHERAVPITTELSYLRPLRDTLVIYVPENVNVEGELWQAVKTVPAEVIP